MSARLRQVGVVLLSAAALSWTAWLLRASWPELQATLPRVRPGWLLAPVVGAVVSGYLGFECFRALFLHLRPGAYARMPLAHLYFMGQLMKHLPGRIWGIAYQARLGIQARPVDWIGLSLANIALATATAIWLAGTVLASTVAILWGCAVLLGGVLLYWLLWSPPLIEAVFRIIERLPLRAAREARIAFEPFVRSTPRFKLRVLLLFAAFWLIYLFSWSGYGLAWPGLHMRDGLVLCSLYTMAWVVGFLSLFTPSGIGVRELTFVLLVGDWYSSDVIAAFAVFGRAVLLVADIVLGVLFCTHVPEQLALDRTTARRDASK
jgi:hypothetical protein